MHVTSQLPWLEMVVVTFRSGDESWARETGRRVRLRDLQRALCHHFRQRFPVMKATLTCGEAVYDEFIDLPFQHCRDEDVFDVSFVKTNDPLFYDIADRVGVKLTLEEEVAYDLAVSDGLATDGIEAWAAARRLTPLREIIPER